MSLALLVPIILAIVGALVVAFAEGKAVELGRALLWCGLFVALLVYTGAAR